MAFCTCYSLFLGYPSMPTHLFQHIFYLFIRFQLRGHFLWKAFPVNNPKVRIRCPSSVLLWNFLFIVVILVYFSISLWTVSSLRAGPVFCPLSFRCSANNCWKGCRSLDFTGVASFFFFFKCHAVLHAGCWFPDQGLNPCPLHWACQVLTVGWPGKSLLLLSWVGFSLY